MSNPLPTDLQDGYTVGQRFREAVSPGYGVRAEAAWQLILDTWRVIEVASARAGAPATPTREEWMAALRIAASRVVKYRQPDKRMFEILHPIPGDGVQRRHESRQK